ncbi:hypothetical protein LVD15_21420 [Fulvivirga maritima]|uniref:hypothetical protein n=1 Tax=Fulvivirga maritima TaxID=2904247 RepID=UPI001F4240FE|nr:hypothetical protein [Fulvivirga maritima]UII25835.1 hypothetical protein LVD15_21420 [Fulvivirga maritima]
MTLAERKNIFFGVLTPYLEKIGYNSYLTGGDPSYNNKVNEYLVVHFFFNFYTNGGIGSSALFLTNYDVEDHILSTGIPTNELIQQRKKTKYHLPTVAFRDLPSSLEEKSLESKEELEEYAHSYITYLENEGQAFIEKYSYLPNILKEMDRLEAEGKYWKEILSGGPEYLFRGVIISKLCNDPKFEDKQLFVDSLLGDLDEWQPYWQKLKGILPTIEPKYSL